MASRMRVTSLTATVVGCPTWIRTRTKASKGPCATVTPSDKPHKTVAFNTKSAKKNFFTFKVACRAPAGFNQRHAKYETHSRSEERRVGKECRSRLSPDK